MEESWHGVARNGQLGVPEFKVDSPREAVRVLEKEAIEAWRQGGAQMPRVLVLGGDQKSSVPFLFNLGEVED